MNACERCLQDLGGYILGGVTDDEAVSVEQHLDACPACRREHAELVGIPALLDAARTEAPEVPPHVRDRLMATAVRDRARRMWLRVTAAAAVAAALIGGLVGWRIADHDPPPIAVALETVEPHEVSGWVTFTDRGDEVLVALDVEGLAPLEPPKVYEAWLSTDDRRIMSIGHVDSRGDGSVWLAARGALSDYQSFWITAEPDARDPAHQGPTVVRAPVPEIR